MTDLYEWYDQHGEWNIESEAGAKGLASLEALFTQALTKERQRIVAALPEKLPQVAGNKEAYINRGYIEGEVNGFNKAIDQAKQAINNQQSKGE